MGDPFAEFGGKADEADPFSEFGGQADPPSGAVGAFKADQPGAFYERDFPGSPASGSPLGKEHQRVYTGSTNLLLPEQAAAVGGIRGLSQLPFVGNLGGKAIEKLTGQEGYSAFDAAAQQQEPVAFGAGEALGAIKGQAMLIEGGLEGTVKAAKSIAGGLATAGAKFGSTGLKVAGKVAQWSGLPAARQVGTILSNAANLVNPKLVLEGEALTGEAMVELGSDLSKTYQKISKTLPKEQLLTKDQLWQTIETTAKDKIAQGSEGLVEADIPRIKKQFDLFVSKGGDDPINPAELWNFAKNIAKRSGKYRSAAKFNPASGSRADLLDLLDQGLREKLYDYATQASQVADESLIQALDKQANEYRTLADSHRLFSKQAAELRKPETQQAGRDLAHQILSKGPKVIGEDRYRKLSRALSYSLEAFNETYAKMFKSDPEFRDINGLVEAPGSPVN